jgi:hypothetical protein
MFIVIIIFPSVGCNQIWVKEKARRKPRLLQAFTQASAMESVGQTFAQAPQEMQVSASMLYWLSPSDIALTGHSDSQAPHLMHVSEILYAIGKNTPKIFKNIAFNCILSSKYALVKAVWPNRCFLDLPHYCSNYCNATCI